MMDKNIEVLEEVLDVLEEEKRKFYDLVDQNDFRIEQINSYLRELSKKEEDDFKVFSPRNAENVHREQIAADTSEKEKYEAENAEYQKKIAFLKNLMEKVNAVIENLQMEKEKEMQQAAEEEEKVQQQAVEHNEEKSEKPEENSGMDDAEREHIAHRILNCVSFIVPDAERAKVELTAIAQVLQKK